MRRFLIGLAVWLVCAPCWAAVAPDGSPATGSVSFVSPIIIAGLTTTSTNDRIVVVAHAEAVNATGVHPTISSITDTAGLSYTLRKRCTLDNAGQGNAYSTTEEWSALSPGALTGDVITINISGTFEDATAVVNGYSGADATNPFDINASLPNCATAAGNTAPTSGAVISTSSTNTMLLGLTGSASGITNTAGAGFTLNGNVNNGSGSNASSSAIEYKAVTSAQSGVTVAFTATAPNGGGWMLISDALCQSGGCATAGGGTTPSTFRLLGVGK